MGHLTVGSAAYWDLPPQAGGTREPPTVLVAANDPELRGALCWSLFKSRADVLVEEAHDLAEMLRRLAEDDGVGLLLMDVSLAARPGSETPLLQAFAAFAPAPVVMLALDGDLEAAGRALALGAQACLPTSMAPQDIAAAVVARLGRAAPARPVPASGPQDLAASLTPAQSRILTAAATGRLNKQIAYDMGVTEATVKAHMSAIFRKLGVRNRTQAIIRARNLD